MYFVYIIESIKSKRRYIGYTSNIESRLSKHNSGGNKSTKPYRPYKLIYVEQCSTKTEASIRERKLKSYKNKSYIDKIISCWDGGAVNRIRL